MLLSNKIDLSEWESNSYPTPGWHVARCYKAELKDSTKGGGQYISVAFKLLTEGPCQDYLVRTMFMIKHENSKVVNMGMEKLCKLASVCGLSELTDTEQLVGNILEINVCKKNQPQEKEDKYGISFDIKGFRKTDDERGSFDSDYDMPF